MNGMNPDEPSDPTAIDATFRSQSVWDATMAASIIEARRRAAALPGRPFSSPKVIHVVGQFHCDFEGGLVQEIDARNGLLKICVISIQRRDGETLAEDDRGRAAIVVYSGARPAKEADPVPDPVGAPTTTPPTPPASPPEGTVPMTIPWPTTPPGPRVNQ